MSRCAHFGGRFGHKMCSLNNNTIDGQGAGASDGNVLRMVMFCTRLNACVLFDAKRNVGITRRHTRFGCFSGAAAIVIKERACLSMHVTRCAAAVHRLEVVQRSNARTSPHLLHRARVAVRIPDHDLLASLDAIRSVVSGPFLVAGASCRAVRPTGLWHGPCAGNRRPLFPAALRRGSPAPG